MWPFTKSTKNKNPDMAKNLRWMARNLCSTSFYFSGEQPEGTGLSSVSSALHELADRIENEQNNSRIQGIVRASIHAYNAAKRWEEYEPGYTEHERMAWEIGRAEVEKVKRP